MKKYCLILVLLTLFLSGCWNRREINELSIGLGMGIDKSNDLYKITIQVVDPSEISPIQSGKGHSPITTYEIKSRSLFEGIRKLTTMEPRKIYLAHLKVLVIGEALAKEGIESSLDFLLRDHEIRSDFFVILAKNGEASSLLENVTQMENIPVDFLYNSLRSSERVWAPTISVKLDDLLKDLNSKGKNAVLSSINVPPKNKIQNKTEDLQQSKPTSYLQYDGIAILKDGRLLDYFNESESKGYNYTIGNVHNTVGAIKYATQKRDVVVEAYHPKSKIVASFENHKPKIKVFVSYHFNIAENPNNYKFTTETSIKKIEHESSASTANYISAAISKAQHLNTDVFGFGEYLRRKSPKEWKKIENNWHDKEFSEASIEVHVKSHFKGTGSISNTK